MNVIIRNPDTTTAKIVLKTQDGGYKKGDNAWVENVAGKNTYNFPISGDSYKLTYYQKWTTNYHKDQQNQEIIQ